MVEVWSNTTTRARKCAAPRACARARAGVAVFAMYVDYTYTVYLFEY